MMWIMSSGARSRHLHCTTWVGFGDGSLFAIGNHYSTSLSTQANHQDIAGIYATLVPKIATKAFNDTELGSRPS